MKKSVRSKGFTLLELLVVIAIIGVLSTVVLASLNSARVRARDAKRLEDMHQIQLALNLYFHDNGRYPGPTSVNGGWEYSNEDGGQFIEVLVMEEYLPDFITDPVNTNQNIYGYYRYAPGAYGCDSSKGHYYVLVIYDMEGTNGIHPQSPGWSCPGRNWQTQNEQFEWATGKFERG